MRNKNIDSQSKIEQVLDIYHRLGVEQITAQKAEQYFNDALEILDNLSKTKEEKRPLTELAHSMMKRKK